MLRKIVNKIEMAGTMLKMKYTYSFGKCVCVCVFAAKKQK